MGFVEFLWLSLCAADTIDVAVYESVDYIFTVCCQNHRLVLLLQLDVILL